MLPKVSVGRHNAAVLPNVESYHRLDKTEMPGVQLALIGAMAGDDPEGWELLEQAQEEAASDPDIFIFTNLAGVGSMEVNVFQRGCDVVIQKSLREGFGLVVSEAFWKEKPVVTGREAVSPCSSPRVSTSTWSVPWRAAPSGSSICSSIPATGAPSAGPAASACARSS